MRAGCGCGASVSGLPVDVPVRSWRPLRGSPSPLHLALMLVHRAHAARYLGDNLFDATLPEELGNLAALRELRVGDNRLEGTLPAAILNLPNLRVLYVVAPAGLLVRVVLAPCAGQLTSLRFAHGAATRKRITSRVRSRAV